MLSFDIFFQFRISKAFLLSTPCILCDSQVISEASASHPQHLRHCRLLESVFLSISFSCPFGVSRSQSFFFCLYVEKFPHVSKCNHSVLPDVSLFLRGAETGFFHHFSHVWRGWAFIKNAHGASKLDLVFMLCTWMCISKGSKATNYEFIIQRLSLKPNKFVNRASD